jgi:hypothetical protein
MVSRLWAQPGGLYYQRGRQVGDAINKAWPGAQVKMVYGFPYFGLQQWVKGHYDAGLNVKIAVEHTYGAGPCTPGQPWFTCAWGGSNTSVVAAHEAANWPCVKLLTNPHHICLMVLCLPN